MLRASPAKWLLVLLGAAAFTAGGVWMVETNSRNGWLVLVFFGLCTVMSVAQLLIPGRLVLDAEGLEIRNLGRTTRHAWTDVEAFGVWKYRASQLVSLSLRPGAPERPRLAFVNRLLGARDGTLPDTYGMEAEELAALLESWRQQASARVGSF